MVEMGRVRRPSRVSSVRVAPWPDTRTATNASSSALTTRAMGKRERLERTLNGRSRSPRPSIVVASGLGGAQRGAISNGSARLDVHVETDGVETRLAHFDSVGPGFEASPLRDSVEV